MFEYFSKLEKLKNENKLRHNFDCDYAALASIGTVADLVPLVGPSRSLVSHGLKAFNTTNRKGLRCIMKESGIEGKPITPYEIGFVIAPRINAVGRLEHAINALRLLCTTSEEKAEELASSVGKTNQQRQELVKKAVEEAFQTVEKMVTEGELPNVIALHSDKWHEGIIGLIASKIVEKYYRPTVIMTEVDGFSKGSARSIPTFHITNFLRGLKKHLVDVGGHTQAAGFTIDNKNVEAFIKAITKESKKLLKPEDLEKVIDADVKLPVSLISRGLAFSLEKLQPFGMGNPQPIFLSDVVLSNSRIFGKKNEHLRIEVKDPLGESYPLELLVFSKAEEYHKMKKGQLMRVVYQIELNRWGGKESLQGRLMYWE